MKLFLTLVVLLGLFFVSSCKTNEETESDVLPMWLQVKIAQFNSGPISASPPYIYSYIYKDYFVYYIAAPCCDQFSDLYSHEGQLLCHPEGGITGAGDGNCNDFKQNRHSEKLIWKNSRI